MGRTVGSLLVGAAAVAAIAFGQPWLAGVIVKAGVAAGATAAALATVIATTVVAGSALLLGLGPSMPKPETTETAIKTPRPPRVSAYGRSRLWGAYGLYETASNGTAVDVYAVHDGEIDAIEAYYLGDDPVTLTGDTVNTGTDGRYRDGAVKLYTTLGQAVGTAFAAIVSLLPGIWTSAHRGDGVVMMALTAAAVKAKRFQETYPQASVPVPSLVARWQKCPDPAAANPADESGWTWTENSVRHLLHYKLKREGVDYATKIAPTIASWIAAAADCDAAMALKAGGTEARYRSSVAHRHTDLHKDVTGALLSTFDGWIAPRADGALVVYSGRFQEPAVSIGTDEIVAYNWDGVGIDDDKAVNEIIVSYSSAPHDYNTVECDAWRDEADISARGQVLSQPLDAQVPSHAQARRLAKRKHARAMASSRGTVTTNVAGRVARGQRYINLHIEEAGTIFYSGPAEIIALTRNMSTGGVTFSWVAASATIDAWDPATEEGEPAANGSRVPSAALSAPSISAATAIYDTGGGATLARIEVTASGPARDDLTWFLRWRDPSSAVWIERSYSDIGSGASVSLVSETVPADSSVEIEVAYQVGDGRISEWSAPASEGTNTPEIAPPAPTNVSALGGTGEASINWRNPTSDSFSYSRVFRNTSSTFAGATDVSGTTPGGLGQVMTFNDSGVAPGSYWYWVVSYSAGGLDSAPAGPATATVS